jgi:hypothetical protein
MPRGFGQAFEFDAPAMPEDPVLIDKQDGTFADIWNRLDRLAEYEPLLRLTYEQSAFDFQPPVRLHGEEVLAETVVGKDRTAVNAANPEVNGSITMSGKPADGSDPLPVTRFFRLDGTVQLRRSRFLHVDLDVEYRLDGPAWQREFGLPPGFEWIGEAPAESRNPPSSPDLDLRNPTPINALQPMTEAGPELTDEVTEPERQPPVEPFQVHRLQQSRQVRTNTLQYFDSAFLSAIVRVTEIADADT